MTKARHRALEILKGAEEPLTATAMYRLMTPGFDQATIYRTLHYLEDHGFAESFILHCEKHGTERYYTSSEIGHRHWFHCEGCHRFIALRSCAVTEMVRDFEKAENVRVDRHILYFIGLCTSCRKAGMDACAQNHKEN